MQSVAQPSAERNKYHLAVVLAYWRRRLPGGGLLRGGLTRVSELSGCTRQEMSFAQQLATQLQEQANRIKTDEDLRAYLANSEREDEP